MKDYTSFIEVQFPVSRVSKESYKERKANLGQTLTGLGKWWGRKPLILVRAALLGLFMPASDNPEKDMEIFLKILTMDDEGLLLRKSSVLPAEVIYKYSTKEERTKFFDPELAKPKYKKTIRPDDKIEIDRNVFLKLGYDEKIKYCLRPEEVYISDGDVWKEINEHLGTKADSLSSLIKELGEKRFGKTPVVGDCFCGGGSVPFEAARMGCDVFASDLNPVAALLTWGALNINGASDEKVAELKVFQNKIYNSVEKQVEEWGIEHDGKGNRALYYLYCIETKCPECGWMVPLAPSWVIGKGTKTVAVLNENKKKGFDFEIKSGVSEKEMKEAESKTTVKGDKIYCPHCTKTAPMKVIRNEKSGNSKDESGLRLWDKEDIVPRPDDVFQERLYCIKWEDIEEGDRFYRAPTADDLKREEKVLTLLKERFAEWQTKGYIPNMIIEEGIETTRLYRERGWRYWHQLFNARQLLIHGLLLEKLNSQEDISKKKKTLSLLGFNRILNFNSKLTRWVNGSGVEKGVDVFSNQALNTLYNYANQAIKSSESSFLFKIHNYCFNQNLNINVLDARNINNVCDFWLTDPPYADAVNYHELSEFFLSWDKKLLNEIFPDWYNDSKRALAVAGKGESFNRSMVEIYSNLANHMPDNGMQIVMFTHQDVTVWAELSMILWSAGLRVTAAWNIATETESGGLKEGNYVKGTVLLVLRKQTSVHTAYLYELYPEIEEEVSRQIEVMQKIDDKDEPNFSDPDYLLAAYAASLKVLTSYKKLEDIDVQYELSRSRKSGEESPVAGIIRNAVKIAYDMLIPAGFDKLTWKSLSREERFYIKGLDMERTGNYQVSALQELARGFGVVDYKDMLASTKANEARLKTAHEYAQKSTGEGFGVSVVREVLGAIYTAVQNESAAAGLTWLHSQVQGYWDNRRKITEILTFIMSFEHIDTMPQWSTDSKYARFINELVINDGV